MENLQVAVSAGKVLMHSPWSLQNFARRYQALLKTCRTWHGKQDMPKHISACLMCRPQRSQGTGAECKGWEEPGRHAGAAQGSAAGVPSFATVSCCACRITC